MKNFRLNMDRVGSLFFIKVYFYQLTTQKYEEYWIGVDTGAATTTLSKDLLYDLGYNVSEYPLTGITTATERDYANVIYLKRLKLGDFELTNIKVNAIDFASPYISGVLGLDLLTKFDVNFLFSQNLIEFTPRTDI